MAKRLLDYSFVHGDRVDDPSPQRHLRCSVETILTEKRRMKRGREKRQLLRLNGEDHRWAIWIEGLHLFRRAHDVLVAEYSTLLTSSSENSSVGDISWETLSTLHRSPIPFLCVLLLGLRLKTSLRGGNGTMKNVFETQETAVDECLEFLEAYLRFSASSFSTSTTKNDSGETIFEFLLRLYFMQVGDPLQLLRHFRYFLSRGNISSELSGHLLRFVCENPLLNPIERLNYVVLMAASSNHHPLDGGGDDDDDDDDGEKATTTLSVRDALFRIQSFASQLSTSITDDVDHDARGEVVEIETANYQQHREGEETATSAGDNEDDERRVSRELGEGEAEEEDGTISEPNTENPVAPDAATAAATTSLDDEEEDEDDSFLPALTLLEIGNCLCTGPPSLKFLTRRCVRSHFNFQRAFSSSFAASSIASAPSFPSHPEDDPPHSPPSTFLPNFILDYLRMNEYRTKKIQFSESKKSAFGVLRSTAELSISFEKILYLQIPVLHRC